MTCKFCGNVIEDNSDICFICGQKVEAAAAPAADGFAPAAPADPAEAPAAPVYVAAPVYAAPAAAPAAPATLTKAEIKAAKKAAKAAEKEAGIGGGHKFFATLFAIIFVVLTFALGGAGSLVGAALVGVYALAVRKSCKKAAAEGNTGKADALRYTAWKGICAGMAIACIVLVYKGFIA